VWPWANVSTGYQIISNLFSGTKIWESVSICLGWYNNFSLGSLNNYFVSSGDWEVQDQVLMDLVSGEGPLPGSEVYLIAVSSHWGRSKAAFYRFIFLSTNPIHEGSILITINSLLRPSHWWLGFLVWILGKHKHSDHGTPPVPLNFMISHTKYIHSITTVTGEDLFPVS
jgi:hypothetical protein